MKSGGMLYKKSDEVIVPVMVWQQNPTGGKSLYFSRAQRGKVSTVHDPTGLC